MSGKALLADQEYIGTEWFALLSEQQTYFVIRLRDQPYSELIDKVLQSKRPPRLHAKRRTEPRQRLLMAANETA